MAQDEYRCEDCNATFANAAELEDHNREVHSRYTCDICGAIVTSQREMDDHSRHLHPETEGTHR